jgi:acylphosphatase
LMGLRVTAGGCCRLSGAMRRVRVQVRGRVQGVFFRTTFAEKARSLGLAGWVRNLPDGSVEAAFEGEADGVEAAIEWCRVGPRFAVVDAVEVLEEPPIGEEGFHITT